MAGFRDVSSPNQGNHATPRTAAIIGRADPAMASANSPTMINAPHHVSGGSSSAIPSASPQDIQTRSRIAVLLQWQR